MIKRRELFSSLANIHKKQEAGSIRPPYFFDESLFEQECIKCDGKCSSACEEKIITIQADKTPTLDFSKGGCTYCDACAHSCDPGVLQIDNKADIHVKIAINILKCISWDKVICFSCKEVCLEDAIPFLGLFRPEIDSEKCTACGFCIKVCPTQAIEVTKWQ